MCQSFPKPQAIISPEQSTFATQIGILAQFRLFILFFCQQSQKCIYPSLPAVRNHLSFCTLKSTLLIGKRVEVPPCSYLCPLKVMKDFYIQKFIQQYSYFCSQFALVQKCQLFHQLILFQSFYRHIQHLLTEFVNLFPNRQNQLKILIENYPGLLLISLLNTFLHKICSYCNELQILFLAALYNQQALEKFQSAKNSIMYRMQLSKVHFYQLKMTYNLMVVDSYASQYHKTVLCQYQDIQWLHQQHLQIANCNLDSNNKQQVAYHQEQKRKLFSLCNTVLVLVQFSKFSMIHPKLYMQKHSSSIQTSLQKRDYLLVEYTESYTEDQNCINC